MKNFKLAANLIAVIVLAVMLAAAFNSVGAVVNAGTNPTPIEPKAGTWKTWVLTSGDQLRLPTPPDRTATLKELEELEALVAKRDAAALEEIAFWNTGAPTYRWNGLAVADSLRANQPGGPGTRALALLNSAMYDATIAAYDSKYAYNRLRPNELDPNLETVIPNPETPSYPSEHAAVAGAASTVLAYLFPDNAGLYAEQAQAAANSRLLAGVEYPSDVTAGLELGRAVGALAVERAKADGFDGKWTGTVPTTPGSWSGTNPAGVMTGTWKPWVLKSGDEVRPPPPFAYDSPEKQKEMEELKMLERTPKQTADAFYNEYGAGSLRGASIWNQLTSKKLFESGLDENGPRAARAYALVHNALYDSTIACFDAKYAYWAIRPFQLDPEFKPLFPTPNHPSYPAAHACANAAPAAVLAYLFPRDANELNAIADAAGESRIWAGIHFPSDVVVGLKLGRDVAQKMIEYAQKDGSQASLATR
jgi:membrane-associated phospholipid phosphatase